MASFVYSRWCPIQPAARVDCRLRGANRIFHGEHHVFWEFAELSDESQILRAFRDDLRTIALGLDAETGW